MKSTVQLLRRPASFLALKVVSQFKLGFKGTQICEYV